MEHAAKPIARARRVASFSGWTTGIFGVLTVATGWGDWPALMLGVGLCVSAAVEVRAGRRLGAFDPSAARTLGFNQIAVGLMLLSFALWRLYQSSNGQSLVSSLATGDTATDEMIASIEKQVRLLVYGTIAAVAILVPGLTAWYYFSRGPRVRRFNDSAPPWAVELLRVVR